MKARILLTLEYKLRPELYPQAYSFDQMMEDDLISFREDPGLLVSTEPFNIAGMLISD